MKNSIMKYLNIMQYLVLILSITGCNIYKITTQQTTTTKKTTIQDTTTTTIPLKTVALIVDDQLVTDSMVTISQIRSTVEGWIVMHRNDQGNPGEVIGFTRLNRGLSYNVQIFIDVDFATDLLFAIPHADKGIIGRFEYPGEDMPLESNGKVIAESFQITIENDENDQIIG